MLRFLRRNKPDVDLETHRLNEHFDVKEVLCDGVPRGIHRVAVDPNLQLFAVICKSGMVEVYYPNGTKKVLLRKLGSVPAFFDFVTGENVLLIVCSDKPGTSILPEVVHFVDTNGKMDCFSHQRMLNGNRGLCYSLNTENGRRCLWFGTDDNKVNCLSWDSTWPSTLNEECVVDLSRTETTSSTKMRELLVMEDHAACVFRDHVVMCNLSDGQVLLSINIARPIEINFKRSTFFFVSSNIITTYSINGGPVQFNGSKSSFFNVVSYFNQIRTERCELTVYCGGFPEDFSRSECVMISDGVRNDVIQLSDVIIQLKVLEDSRGLADTLLILTEHEFLAVDLNDPNYARLPLPQLNCVDFSTVSTIAVEKLSYTELKQSHLIPKCRRSSLFFGCNNVEQTGDIVVTGHQNGDVVIWSACSGGQQIVKHFRTRDFVVIGDQVTNDDDDMNVMESCPLEESDVTVERYEQAETSCQVNPLIKTPTQIFGSHNIVKHEIGMYDERCEEDGYSVDTLSILPQKRLVLCGLNCGLAFVFPYDGSVELTHSNVRLLQCNMSNGAAITERQPKFTIRSPTVLSSPKPFKHVLSLWPSTPIRSMAMSVNSDQVVVGSSTGIVVYDVRLGEVIFNKNFLTPEATKFVVNEEKPLTRLKSMKQSVRRTFRGKKGSTRNRPVMEREVEFRNAGAPQASGFRALRMFEPTDQHSFFMAGTGNGVLYLFGLNSDTCTLFKELRLSNRSPICSIDIAADETSTRFIVCSEEQVRSFFVDTLKPAKLSCKVTAKMGIKIRRGVVVQRSAFSYIALLCNDGTLMALSLKDRHVHVSKPYTETSDTTGLRIAALSSTGSMACATQSGAQIRLCHFVQGHNNAQKGGINSLT